MQQNSLIKYDWFNVIAGDALGGDTYWLAGLHLYTPLPFRPGAGSFGELFRTHLFVNAGNLCNIDFNNFGEYCLLSIIGNHLQHHL